jgi:hypothetical protein
MQPRNEKSFSLFSKAEDTTHVIIEQLDRSFVTPCQGGVRV